MIQLMPEPAVRALNFKVYPPWATLVPWVQCVWTAEPSTGCARSADKLYPDGGFGLLITLGDEGPHVTLELNRHTRQRFLAAGTQVLGVRFFPEAYKTLVGTNADMCDQDSLPLGVDLRPLWFAALEAALHRAYDAMAPLSLAALAAEVQCVFDQYLLRMGDEGDQSFQLIRRLQHSTLPLSALGDELGMTRRTMERRTRRATGFSPAVLQNLARMHKARYLLSRSEPKLVDIANECGFFDQAHFHHAFREFTLETPAHYRQRKLSQIYKAPPA